MTFAWWYSLFWCEEYNIVIWLRSSDSCAVPQYGNYRILLWWFNPKILWNQLFHLLQIKFTEKIQVRVNFGFFLTVCVYTFLMRSSSIISSHVSLQSLLLFKWGLLRLSHWAAKLIRAYVICSLYCNSRFRQYQQMNFEMNASPSYSSNFVSLSIIHHVI